MRHWVIKKALAYLAERFLNPKAASQTIKPTSVDHAGSRSRNLKYLRRTATEAQLGWAIEFALKIELHFDFQVEHEFELELARDSELRLGLDLEFEFEIQLKFEPDLACDL